jgi:hypothetical protein
MSTHKLQLWYMQPRQRDENTICILPSSTRELSRDECSLSILEFFLLLCLPLRLDARGCCACFTWRLTSCCSVSHLRTMALPLHPRACMWARSYNRWPLHMGPTITCAISYLLLQHLDETLATCVRNNWNTCNIRLKHQEKDVCIHCKTYTTSKWNTCNICVKYMQHLDETHLQYMYEKTYETLGTDVCNISVQRYVTSRSTFATSIRNPCNISLKQLKYACNMRFQRNVTSRLGRMELVLVELDAGAELDTT